MLSAKAERGLPPFRERERERQRERDRERERFTYLYRYSHDCKHAYKAMVSPEKMLFLFFLFSTSKTKIRWDLKDLIIKEAEKNEKIETKWVVNENCENVK